MKNKIIALVILVALMIIPAKWAYFEIDRFNAAPGLFSFLSIIAGVFICFFLFTSNKQKQH